MVQDSVRSVQVRSQLLPLLRTPLLGELLAWIYLHPDEEWSVTDLARRFRVSQSTVSREADRLVAGELLGEVRRGSCHEGELATGPGRDRPDRCVPTHV